jgi:hypothetical protein
VFIKDVALPLQEAELVGTSSSNKLGYLGELTALQVKQSIPPFLQVKTHMVMHVCLNRMSHRVAVVYLR